MKGTGAPMPLTVATQPLTIPPAAAVKYMTPKTEKLAAKGSQP
jgi:hypothetical protein